MDQFEATAAAIAGRVGIEPDQLAAILRERTRFVRAERQQDALQAAAQSLLAGTTECGSLELTAAGQPSVRPSTVTYGDFRRVDRASRSDAPQRMALMRLAYTRAQQQAAILLTSPNHHTRSIANVQAQTGLSRRGVQQVKDSLPKLEIALKMIFSESG